MGILVPAGILIWSNDIKALIVASALVTLSLLITLPFRPVKNRLDVVVLSWVLPYLIITGSLEVKFMRYMIPVTPFLILFGSQMLSSFWDTALNYFRKIKSEIDIYKYVKIFLILSGIILTLLVFFIRFHFLRSTPIPIQLFVLQNGFKQIYQKAACFLRNIGRKGCQIYMVIRLKSYPCMIQMLAQK